MSISKEEKVHLFNRARIRLRMLQEELGIIYESCDDSGPIQVFFDDENLGGVYESGEGVLAEHLE